MHTIIHNLHVIGLYMILLSGLIFSTTYLNDTKKLSLKKIIQEVTYNKISDSISVIEKKLKRKLPERNKIITLLLKGEKDFGVNHKDIIAIMAHESGFRKWARNKNTNKSVDYGLSQQNGKYILARYRSASKYLKHYKIKYKSVYSKYDVGLNVMSAILFQHDIGKVTKNHRRLIASYNTGIYGYFRNKKIANKYYKSVMKYRNSI